MDRFSGKAILLPSIEDLVLTKGTVTVVFKNTETGEVWIDEYPNLITDVGDLYIAQKQIHAVPPANASPPNFINGVKLGTGVTAATKAGAASALGAYISVSNKGLDDVSTPGFGGGPYPKVDNSLGSGNGVRAVYCVSYPAGVVINAAISEAILATDSGVDLTSSSSATIARSLIGPYNKTAPFELDILWQHLHQGS